jgi:hypothetical protein
MCINGRLFDISHGIEEGGDQVDHGDAGGLVGKAVSWHGG